MQDNPDKPQLSTDTDDTFLQRWSRRKQQAVTDPAADTLPAEVAPPAPPTEAEALTDADMPPLESLDEHADYSGFLSPKVSAELRRAALRKLFRAPRFNITDGLNDYDEDYRSYTALGEVITHEMRRMWEREKARAEAEAEADAETAIASADEAEPIQEPLAVDDAPNDPEPHADNDNNNNNDNNDNNDNNGTTA